MPSIRARAEAAQPGSGGGAPPAVLALSNLSVRFDTPRGAVLAAQDIDLAVARGECLGVLGESGAGKSQLFLAVLGLLAANGHVQGSARFGSTELLGLAPAALDQVRGAGIGLVFQDPMASLTPHLTVGAQLTEVLVRHRGLAPHAARRRAPELLERMRLSDPRRRLGQYPHQLSGGMCQRVMIALALAGEPQLLIADEPTTALDVTIQAQILALLAELKRERGMALILITHDLTALAGVADSVVVMRAGRIIERGPVAVVLKTPRETYTRELLREASALDCEQDPPRSQVPVPPDLQPPGAASAPAALGVEELTVRFELGRGWLGARPKLTALDAVSLALRPGETLGVVGESGCGKSTLARAALRLLTPSSGRVVWLGRELTAVPPRELRALRRDLQLVFQDPFGSLDPRMTVAETLAEPLRVHEPALAAAARSEAVAVALARVGLDLTLAARYPHELSGGQCQRVGLARALILKPRVLVCDEALSALDALTQQQIAALLEELTLRFGLTLMFISHNLALVRRLCRQVLVLYLGHMMQLAPARVFYRAPRHPYARELLAALPSADPELQPARLAAVQSGEPPSPLEPPSGCVYRTRCAHALAVCAERQPAWEEAGPRERIACHRWRELG